MDFKAEIVINRMNNILNTKYEKDPDFSRQRKDWAFFVSVPTFVTLKYKAGEYTSTGSIAVMRGIELEVLGCSVFTSDGLEDNDIYFAKKLQIEEGK